MNSNLNACRCTHNCPDQYETGCLAPQQPAWQKICSLRRKPAAAVQPQLMLLFINRRWPRSPPGYWHLVDVGAGC